MTLLQNQPKQTKSNGYVMPRAVIPQVKVIHVKVIVLGIDEIPETICILGAVTLSLFNYRIFWKQPFWISHKCICHMFFNAAIMSLGSGKTIALFWNLIQSWILVKYFQNLARIYSKIVPFYMCCRFFLSVSTCSPCRLVPEGFNKCFRHNNLARDWE